MHGEEEVAPFIKVHGINGCINFTASSVSPIITVGYYRKTDSGLNQLF